MTVFIESPRFPDDVSFGSKGGPKYSTHVQTYQSGSEKRNANWMYPRHDYNAATGVRTVNDLYKVLEFFHVASGKAYGFRYKDWLDYKSGFPDDAISSTDQIIGEGDGAKTQFQLMKAYIVGVSQKARIISKPVQSTVTVAVDGVTLASGWTVNYATGIVTLTTPPALGIIVTAGFEFDVPVRFDTDELSVDLSEFDAAEATIPMIELRL